jgi:TonB family protein
MSPITHLYKDYIRQRYRSILFISIGLTLTAAALFSAAPPLDYSKWWKDSSIADQMHLTESQIEQIEQCFLNHRSQLEDLDSKLKSREADLRNLIQKDPMNESAVRAQSKKVDEAKRALVKEDIIMLISMSKALSREQMETLKKIRAAAMTSADAMPIQERGVIYPKAIYKTPPKYTEEAKRARVSGIVMLKVIVRKDGTVDSFQVIHGLGHGLDQSAIQTIEHQWRFQPGMKDGQPVDAELFLDVRFRLQ